MAIEDRAAADLMQLQQDATAPDGSADERPPTRDDPPLAHQRIAAPIQCMYDNRSFDRLERVDAALVDGLVSIGRFDVALVNFKPSTGRIIGRLDINSWARWVFGFFARSTGTSCTIRVDGTWTIWL